MDKYIRIKTQAINLAGKHIELKAATSVSPSILITNNLSQERAETDIRLQLKAEEGISSEQFTEIISAFYEELLDWLDDKESFVFDFYEVYELTREIMTKPKETWDPDEELAPLNLRYTGNTEDDEETPGLLEEG